MKLLCKFCGESVEMPDGISAMDCPVCGKVIERPDVPGGARIDKLLERIRLLLHDGDWERATRCSDLLLDETPLSAHGFLFRYMATHQLRDVRTLWCDCDAEESLAEAPEIRHAVDYANEELKGVLQWQIAAQAKFSLFCRLKQCGNSFDNIEMLKFRREVREFCNVNDLAGAEEYLQRHLDEEKQKCEALLTCARELAAVTTEETNAEFKSVMNRLKALSTTKYPPVVKFLNEELPLLQDQQLTSQVNAAFQSAPDGTEEINAFTAALTQFHRQLVALVERGSAEARTCLQQDYPKLCYDRACSEQAEGHYDNAIMLFRCCGGYQDAVTRQAKCEQSIQRERKMARVKKHLAWIVPVVLLLVVTGVVVRIRMRGFLEVRKSLKSVETAISSGQYDLAAQRLAEKAGEVGEDEPYWQHLHAKLLDKYLQSANKAIAQGKFDEANKLLDGATQLVGAENSRVKAARQKAQETAQQKWITEMVEYAQMVIKKRDYVNYAATVDGLRKILQLSPDTPSVNGLLQEFVELEPYPGFTMRLSNQKMVCWESTFITQRLWVKIMHSNLRDQARQACLQNGYPNGSDALKRQVEFMVNGKDGADLPICWVSVSEAMEFCRRLSGAIVAEHRMPNGYHINYFSGDFGGNNERRPYGFRVVLMPAGKQ
ncbi:MAG: hypothetical protein IKO65_04640 [Victivallales bacterium]|nr:hypothetical protein [Victivallales bacterium]